MKLDDFERAQSIKLKVLAYENLRTMLELEQVVLLANNVQEDHLADAFIQIFGDQERIALDVEIKKDMIMMVINKIRELNAEFDAIGENKVSG